VEKAMKFLNREDIVGKRIANILQTEPEMSDNFSTRLFVVYLHDGTLFEMGDCYADPPVVNLPDLDLGALLPLEDEESDIVEWTRDRIVLEVCSWSYPSIVLLLEGMEFLSVIVHEYGVWPVVLSLDEMESESGNSGLSLYWNPGQRLKIE
jgi:hypothetical protein